MEIFSKDVVIIIILLILISIGVYFLCSRKFNSTAFITYIGLLLLSSFAFYTSDRLTSFDAKNMKIVLNEIHETKRDIYAKAEYVGEMGENIAELVAYNAARSNRAAGKDHVDNLVAFRFKIMSLLDNLGSYTKRKKEIIEPIDEIVIKDLVNETVYNAQKCASTKLTENDIASLQKEIEDHAGSGGVKELLSILEKYGADCQESENSAARLYEFILTKKLSKLTK